MRGVSETILGDVACRIHADPAARRGDRHSRSNIAWSASRFLIHGAFTNAITPSMDDNRAVARYTTASFGAAPVTRSDWKTVVLTAIERSGRPLSLWAVGPGPKESGRWFANFTDRGTGGHVPLGSSMGLGPFGMLEDLVRQLEGPDHALRQREETRTHQRHAERRGEI